MVAIVDVRGTAASFGSRECELGPDEQQDMDEVLRHLAAQPWSNRKIVATGVSYTANTADMATTRAAPALVAAIPRATDFDYWEIFWPGGIANGSLFKDWAKAVRDLDIGRSKLLFESGHLMVRLTSTTFPISFRRSAGRRGHRSAAGS